MLSKVDLIMVPVVNVGNKLLLKLVINFQLKMHVVINYCIPQLTNHISNL